ncbi:AMP-binding protein [Microvirga sp. W0021]|uniref:AMP-binding protein n=1 Tax=Hohaiivirga grylli TaxID=3133970 RepID=A0ABV0BHS2_9HYPH
MQKPIGQFKTTVEALQAAASCERHLRFHDGNGTPTVTLSYEELNAQAISIAQRLHNYDLRAGDRVAIAAETRPEFLYVFYGCQYAGIIPCPLPYRSRFEKPGLYAAKIGAMLRNGEIKAVISLPEQDYIADIALENTARAISYDALTQAAAGDLPPPPQPDDIAYIQFSSGSTSEPKGILISHRALSANVSAILTYGMQLREDDRAFSWLPFYHDMGLVGFSIAPVYGACNIDYMPSVAFARRPMLWLKLMAEYGTTITYAPDFAYRLVAERFSSETAIPDLSHLRIAGIGGDMIRADTLATFASALKPTGFNPDSFLPSYGMAEATLAISFGRAGHHTDIDQIDYKQASQTGTVIKRQNVESPQDDVRSFVSCGVPLPGMDVIIADTDGRLQPDRQIGCILIKGESLMQGYTSGNTEPVFDQNGFMDTGDLGYMRSGQLFITGRSKDLIIFRGRNIWPQDIERIAEHAISLSHGRTLAFSTEVPGGDDQVILLVQATEDPETKDKIHTAISQALGISCDIIFVPSGRIPRTSSGKLARARAKALFLKAD